MTKPFWSNKSKTVHWLIDLKRENWSDSSSLQSSPSLSTLSLLPNFCGLLSHLQKQIIGSASGMVHRREPRTEPGTQRHNCLHWERQRQGGGHAMYSASCGGEWKIRPQFYLVLQNFTPEKNLTPGGSCFLRAAIGGRSMVQTSQSSWIFTGKVFC